MICFNMAHNIDKMTPHAILNTLRVLANTELEKTEFNKENLEKIEQIVIDNYPKFVALDIATVISSFLKLHYIPRDIIDEVNKMAIFSTLNKHAILMILESLTERKYDENYEFYEKLVTQFKKTASYLTSGMACKAL